MPSASTACASSVHASADSAANARRRTPKRNICGVCACQSPARATVAATRGASASPSPRFSVSATGIAEEPARRVVAQVFDEPRQRVARHARARRIVDEDPVVVGARGGERGECVAHGDRSRAGAAPQRRDAGRATRHPGRSGCRRVRARRTSPPAPAPRAAARAYAPAPQRRQAARTASAPRRRTARRRPRQESGRSGRAIAFVRAGARCALRPANESPSVRRNATRLRWRDGSRSHPAHALGLQVIPQCGEHSGADAPSAPVRMHADVVELGDGVPRDVEIARHTRMRPPRPPPRRCVRARARRIPARAGQETGRAHGRAPRRRRRRTRPPTRDSARRRRGTRRAAHARRRASRCHRRAAQSDVRHCHDRRGARRDGMRGTARSHAPAPTTSGTSAARTLAGTSAGRSVARSTHTCTNRPVAAGVSDARGNSAIS